MTVLDDPQDMMAAHFAGVLDRAGSDRLAEWIHEGQANAKAFARFAIEQHALEHLLRVEKYGNIGSLSHHDFNADAANGESSELNELKLLSQMEENAPLVPVVLEKSAQALHSKDVSDGFALFSAGQRRTIVIARPIVWGAVAAMVLVGFFIAGQFWPNQTDSPSGGPTALSEMPKDAVSPAVVAVVEGQSDPEWLDGEQRATGSLLFQGDYRLSQGSIRIRFNNGALVHIESPARFSLDTDAMMTLDEGRLVSHCEDRAHGFTVRTPYSDFIDLGTEFGVSVTPWREAQLHVFQGEVKAIARQPRLSQNTSSQIVRTSEAVAIGPIHSQAIEPLAKADTQLFDTIRRRVVASINTGAKLDNRDGDQRWLVTQINQRRIDPPMPAVLFIPPTQEDLQRGPLSKVEGAIFLPNEPGERCWIKPDPSLTTKNINTTTYATSFDLEGYDADSASLDLGYNADNFVSAVRLNGRLIPIPSAPNEPPFIELSQIKIQDGFLPGLNQIEIVVTNAKPEARPTYTGLVAELSITAQPDWIAAPEERPIPD